MKNKKSTFNLSYPDKKSEESIIKFSKSARFKTIKKFGSVYQLDWTNKLIKGDNLPLLKALYEDNKIRGNVRLVYIDPPFSTGRIFDENDDMTNHKSKVYSDTIQGYKFVEFLRERLIFLRELLAKDGSIYVHLDQRMAPHIKLIMDEIFGENKFRNWISRKKCNSKNTTKNTYGNIQDFILYYSKNKKPVWNRPYDKITKEKIISSEYRYIEEGTGRLYKKVPIHAPGKRNGETGKPWRGKMPLNGKHWQYLPKKLEEFDKQGRIYWSPTGNPRLKLYLDERKGITVHDIWLNYLDPMNQYTSVTGYPTEKNQNLLERIIKASSNESDIILDCFAGSGTTLAAAEKLNRRWIGIDKNDIAIETTKNRLLNFSQKNNEPLKVFEICEI